MKEVGRQEEEKQEREEIRDKGRSKKIRESLRIRYLLPSITSLAEFSKGPMKYKNIGCQEAAI